uniref:Uncharacterized protein n=1 Tax=Parascaris univalens TaxID=6257 RepID=A0A915BX84_PARUN
MELSRSQTLMLLPTLEECPEEMNIETKQSKSGVWHMHRSSGTSLPPQEVATWNERIDKLVSEVVTEVGVHVAEVITPDIAVAKDDAVYYPLLLNAIVTDELLNEVVTEVGVHVAEVIVPDIAVAKDDVVYYPLLLNAIVTDELLNS